jgi:hypothetical protein
MPRTVSKEYPQKDNASFPLFSPAKSKAYLLSCDSIRTSDAWSLLNYTIRVGKDRSTRQPLNKDQRTYLLDVLEQAEYFYKTAQTAPIKSQPLLYYYSFMNLAKIAINLNRFVGNNRKYIHGISENIQAKSTLANSKITLWGSKGGKVSNSEALIKLLEDPLPPYVLKKATPAPSCEISVLDLMRDCIGVHRTYSETYNTSEHFYRLSDIKCYSKRNRLFFDAIVENCDDTLMASLNANGYSISKDADSVFHFNVDSYVKTTPSPTIAEWHSLAVKIRSYGLWSYTNGEEYKLFISPTAQKLSSPSIIYHAMFFFGSITRYHPDLFDSMLSAKEYWLVSEFLKTQPQQFLYYILSYINGTRVLFSKQI